MRNMHLLVATRGCLSYLASLKTILLGVLLLGVRIFTFGQPGTVIVPLCSPSSVRLIPDLSLHAHIKA